MRKQFFLLTFIFLFVFSGCSSTHDKTSSGLTNENLNIDNSSLTENSESVNAITSIDEVDESYDTNSETDTSVFLKKNITKIELLEKEYKASTNGKKIYGKNFVVKSINEDSNIINKMSLYLFGEAIIKSTDNWVKFNPAHANYKAINVYCDDDTKYVINLHFSENSETKHIAVATTNSDADYNDFVNRNDAEDIFVKCIANQEFGKFLIELF